jgi:hypothetical protein
MISRRRAMGHPHSRRAASSIPVVSGALPGSAPDSVAPRMRHETAARRRRHPPRNASVSAVDDADGTALDTPPAAGWEPPPLVARPSEHVDPGARPGRTVIPSAWTGTLPNPLVASPRVERATFISSARNICSKRSASADAPVVDRDSPITHTVCGGPRIAAIRSALHTIRLVPRQRLRRAHK